LKSLGLVVCTRKLVTQHGFVNLHLLRTAMVVAS